MSLLRRRGLSALEKARAANGDTEERIRAARAERDAVVREAVAAGQAAAAAERAAAVEQARADERGRVAREIADAIGASVKELKETTLRWKQAQDDIATALRIGGAGDD